jgi:hypothetical protein
MFSWRLFLLFFSHLQRERASQPLFRTMKKLGLIFNSDRPVGWIPFVSIFIDLTTITHIVLTGTLILKGNPDIVTDIASLLKQACNVSSLIICAMSFAKKSDLIADDICSMTPVHVKHLVVPIKNLHEVKTVLERLEHLSSAQFFFDDTPCWREFHEWFKTNKQGLSYRTERLSLHIWLEENSVTSNEVRVGHKRIKLADEHDDS